MTLEISKTAVNILICRSGFKLSGAVFKISSVVFEKQFLNNARYPTGNLKVRNYKMENFFLYKHEHVST